MNLKEEKDLCKYELKNLCEEIIEASLHWNGNDELKNPKLKRIRTLAKYYTEKYKNT